MNDLEELILVYFVSPIRLPQLVDSFNGLRQSLVGFLVYFSLLDVKVFTVTLEGRYPNFEGSTRGPGRGGAGIGRGPRVSGEGGSVDDVADDGNSSSLEVTISAGGDFESWGRRDDSFPLNETRQEVSEMLWGWFSAWIDGGLGYA